CDLTGDSRTFHMRTVGTGSEVRVVHRVEDPALRRLQSVANIGQCARRDDGHGVVEERPLHLLLDLDGLEGLVDEHLLLAAPVGTGRTTAATRAPATGLVRWSARHQISRKRTSLALWTMKCLRF